MKSMESDAGSRVENDIRKLQKSVRMMQRIILALALLLLALLVILIAVGASQGNKISKLRNRANPNVTLSSNSGDPDNDLGLHYGGSLFRGSGFWAAKNPLPHAVADHNVVAVGEVIYIFGGGIDNQNNGDNGTFDIVTSQVLRYDPILHTYTPMAPMPQPRYRMGVTLLDNGNQDTIYVVGGRKDSYENGTSLVRSVFIYNIPNDTWTIGPTDAPINQSDTCAGSIAGKVYQIGGYSYDYSYLNATYEYDPTTAKWTQLADMPTARGDLMCINFLGEVYALGGYYNDLKDPNNAFSNSMESFNPATGVWTTRPNLLTPRGDAGVAVLDGDRIMLVGGEGHYEDNSNYKYPKHVNEVYYADDQTWVQKAFIPTARFRTAAATAGGLTYVIGGADLCTNQTDPCPELTTNEVFLDLDHPRVYIYLNNDAYNDTAQTMTYPL